LKTLETERGGRGKRQSVPIYIISLPVADPSARGCVYL
jgi:hypothetical protein